MVEEITVGTTTALIISLNICWQQNFIPDICSGLKANCSEFPRDFFLSREHAHSTFFAHVLVSKWFDPAFWYLCPQSIYQWWVQTLEMSKQAVCQRVITVESKHAPFTSLRQNLSRCIEMNSTHFKFMWGAFTLSNFHSLIRGPPPHKQKGRQPVGYTIVCSILTRYCERIALCQI